MDFRSCCGISVILNKIYSEHKSSSCEVCLVFCKPPRGIGLFLRGTHVSHSFYSQGHSEEGLLLLPATCPSPLSGATSEPPGVEGHQQLLAAGSELEQRVSCMFCDFMCSPVLRIRLSNDMLLSAMNSFRLYSTKSIIFYFLCL